MSMNRAELSKTYRRWYRANAAATAAHDADNRRLTRAINRWHASARALHVASMACVGITGRLLGKNFPANPQSLIDDYTRAYAVATPEAA